MVRVTALFLALLSLSCFASLPAPTVVPDAAAPVYSTVAYAPQVGREEAVFTLTGDITSLQGPALREFIYWAKRGGAKLLVVKIESDGGDAQGALDIFEAIKSADMPSRCEVEKVASSGGFLVLQACDVRQMKVGAAIAIHHPLLLITKPGAVTLEDAQDISTSLTRMADLYDTLIAARMKMPVLEYRTHVLRGALWMMDAAEALRAHAVDVLMP